MVRKVDREILLGFVEEVRGYLPIFLDCLEEVKKDHNNQEALVEAHRLFHSIKGAASMVGLSDLSHIAYFVEELMEEISVGKVGFNQKIVKLMLMVVFEIENYLDGVVANNIEGRSILIRVAAEFVRLKGLPESEIPARVEELLNNISLNVDESDDESKNFVSVDETTFEDDLPFNSSTAIDDLDNISPEIIEAFLEEATEHLQEISRNLILLEEEPTRKDILQLVRRAVHTLKGAAAMVGFRITGQLSHRMEDLLDHLYESNRNPTAQMLSLIATTVDTLEDLIQHEDQDRANRTPALYQSYQQLLSEVSAIPPTRGTGALRLPNMSEIIDLEQPPIAPSTAETDPRSASQSSKPTSSHFVRVPIERLDELVRLVSELVVNRATFEQYLRALTHEVDEMRLSSSHLKRMVIKTETEFEASTLEKGLTAFSEMAVTAFADNATTKSKNFSQNIYGFDALEFDRYTDFHLLIRELNETASDISSVSGELTHSIGDFGSYLGRLEHLTGEIQDKLMRLRMVPLANITARLQRIVRVTAEQQGKQARLTIGGEDVEIDKTVLEELADPLLHILRNAVDHGIEPSELRQAIGKSARGEIKLNAYYEAAQAVIRISDDGGGIDPEMLRQTAINNGYLADSDASNISDQELFSLIFMPGFTTANQISEISGRGIGLDIVKATINKLKGNISVDSVVGKGVTFTIRLPLTLAVTRVILVKANNETFAVPLASITRILRAEPHEIQRINEKEFLPLDGNLYPITRLGEALNLKQPADESVSRAPALVINLGNRQIVLIVDHILEAREVVVKSAGNMLQKVHGIIGATIIGDGSVVLILNPQELSQGLTKKEVKLKGLKSEGESLNKVLNVLIVDDSVSVRRVMASLIKRAGWRSTEAKDGLEALDIIQNSNKHPDVILLDIEMPRMDGYELTTTLRANRDYKAIPVIMLTSRAGDKHRHKALTIGVNEFLVKPYQEEILLNVIRRVTQSSQV